jgi:hypothetical protein
MIHLTLTGFHAGQTYCGAPRNEGDTYQHPAYNNTAWQAQLDNPNLCLGCKHEATIDEGD